jgi:hypothetical protein
MNSVRPFVVVFFCMSLAVHAAEVDFNRDIRPILSENCFACHGPDKDKRKSGLRLDTKDGAYGAGKSGKVAVVPGDVAKSEMIVRVTATDDEDIMPPPEQHKKVTPEQLALLKQWIAGGAFYDKHWALKKVQAPGVPAVKDLAWCRNDIDRFIRARLEKEGLKPSPEESKERLLRRVTLDLTGLPPTLAEVDAFTNDAATDAFEKVVDRLLASPHFGERMAVPWLDLARFADTSGYHNDSLREMWLWRDWVVNAFNQNKPFSDFTVEQLAGDLLPNATVEQKVATGFNRNVMTSDEGGIIAAEYLNLYVIDRVNTTGIAFLGMTVGCAQCHDHKYDPLTQHDYYRLYAFFHNVPETGIDGTRVHNPKPFMLVPTAEQKSKLEKFDADLTVAGKEVAERNKSFDAEFKRWLADEPKAAQPQAPAGQVGYFPLSSSLDGLDADGKPLAAKLTGFAVSIIPAGRAGGSLRFETKGHFEAGNNFKFERDQSFSAAAWVMLKSGGTGHLLGKLDGAPGYRGWRVEMQDARVAIQLIGEWDKNAIEVRTAEQYPQNAWMHLAFAYNGSGKASGVTLFVNGKPVKLDVKKDTLKGTLVSAAPFSIGGPQNSALLAQVDDVRIFNRKLEEADARALILLGARQLLEIPAEKRSAMQTKDLQTIFRAHVDTALADADRKVAELKKARDEFEKTIPNAMVMEEMPKPRDTFVKVRGAYDKDGEKVVAGVPGFLPPLPPSSSGKPPTRLDLAEWLISPEHPLTSRVAINRWWATIFGTGLVKTVNDFGMQGESPSHFDLLEWLAADYMRDWNTKRVIRQMVLSATYRQSSRVTKELLERDSANRLLARGPRNRLDAEFVRDNALAISGLLNPEMGGKGILPPQPPGIWDATDGGAYNRTQGAAQYRRGLYVYWRRSTPYPSFLTFDAPQREVCAALRARTSTPLQALILMNDPVYVEAARAFAARTFKEGGADNAGRLRYMWRAALGRAPSEQELAVLEKVLQEQLAGFKQDPKAAEKLLKVGDLPNPAGVNTSEFAAWTALGNVILNLNETITN